VLSDEEELVETADVIHDLIHVERIAPDRIVIVGRHRLEHSPYAENPVLDGVQIVGEDAKKPSGIHIQYATVYRFKGLEADCAILTGFPRPLPELRSRKLYVAASHAKMLLHLMYRQ
jgi:hypothetical protein